MKRIYHLAKRFFGALSDREISSEDRQWVESHLGVGEFALWGRMPNHDQRHAVAVSRRVESALLVGNNGPESSTDWIEVSLMHDVGKLPSRLSVLGRANATIVWGVAKKLGIPSSRLGHRVDLYVNHSSIGAALIIEAGGSTAASDWARNHHRHDNKALVVSEMIPAQIVQILSAADDD